MRKTTKALVFSVVSLIVCLALLVGTTFAWFTDSVTSTNNIVKSGRLDMEVYWTEDLASGQWNDAGDSNDGHIFEYKKWEPGYTAVRYIKIVNTGSLALQYSLRLIADGDAGILGDVIDVYYVENAQSSVSTLEGVNKAGVLTDVLNGSVSAGGVLLPKGVTEDGYYTEEIVVAIALRMQDTAGNKYQNISVGTSFAFQLLATQFDYESDSFGSEYDDEAKFPVTSAGELREALIKGGYIVLCENITVETNTLVVPEGVKANLYLNGYTINGFAEIDADTAEDHMLFDVRNNAEL